MELAKQTMQRTEHETKTMEKKTIELQSIYSVKSDSILKDAV